MVFGIHYLYSFCYDKMQYANISKEKEKVNIKPVNGYLKKVIGNLCY